MQKIKVALAGFGSGGRIYNAPIIAALDEFLIMKILTGNPNNIQAANQDFPVAEVVQEYSDILEDTEIDLVVITTPNHLHKEYAEKALMAGKHVVVEKPLSPTYAEAEYLTALAAKRNRILSVNHNRRWDSDIRTIRKIKISRSKQLRHCIYAVEIYSYIPPNTSNDFAVVMNFTRYILGVNHRGEIISAQWSTS